LRQFSNENPLINIDKIPSSKGPGFRIFVEFHE
jgi:hypothetical protein